MNSPMPIPKEKASRAVMRKEILEDERLVQMGRCVMFKQMTEWPMAVVVMVGASLMSSLVALRSSCSSADSRCFSAASQDWSAVKRKNQSL